MNKSLDDYIASAHIESDMEDNEDATVNFKQKASGVEVDEHRGSQIQLILGEDNMKDNQDNVNSTQRPYINNKTTETQLQKACTKMPPENIRIVQQFVETTMDPNPQALMAQLFKTNNCGLDTINPALFVGNNVIDKSYAGNLQLIQHILNENKSNSALKEINRVPFIGNQLSNLDSSYEQAKKDNYFPTSTAVDKKGISLTTAKRVECLNSKQMQVSNTAIDLSSPAAVGKAQKTETCPNFLQALQATEKYAADADVASKLELVFPLPNGRKLTLTPNAANRSATSNNKSNPQSSIGAGLKRSNRARSNVVAAAKKLKANLNKGLRPDENVVNATSNAHKNRAETAELLRRVFNASATPTETSNKAIVQLLGNKLNADFNSLIGQRSKISNTNAALTVANNSGTFSGIKPFAFSNDISGFNVDFNSFQNNLFSPGLTNLSAGYSLLSNPLATNTAGLNSMQASLNAGHINFNALFNSNLLTPNAGRVGISNSYGGNGMMLPLSNNNALLSLLVNSQRAAVNNSVMSLAPANILNGNFGLGLNLNANSAGLSTPIFNNGGLISFNGLGLDKPFGFADFNQQ